MTRGSRLTVHRGLAVLIGIALLLAGAGATFLLMRTAGASRTERAEAPAGEGGSTASGGAADPRAARAEPSNAPLPDVLVPLAPDVVERAGIVVAPVATISSGSPLRLPAVVEPNAYRQVAVTPLVAGRITRVSTELGSRVRRGQLMAQIYSPQLAEAQMRYVSTRAVLHAHERELQRTQKLVEIGAASRQELERIHAEHAAQTAAVQSARSQLELLGVAPATVDRLATGGTVSATIGVPAPINGVVTERTANVGLNVDPATKLFTVVDLSTVWVVADVYEKDLARVRVGTEATVTSTAFPGLTVRGRVSYIDPQVSAETRTARVRVEVPNSRGDLRLGMYADVVLTEARGEPVAAVPRSAVQNVGDRTVVYLSQANERGTFVEREVRLGRTTGAHVEVVSGVQTGDVVVTEGSFFVRAERERLGLRPAAAGSPPAASSSHGEARNDMQSAKIAVTEKGFEPPTVSVRAGVLTRITFVRTAEKTCGTHVVLPALKTTRALPLNQPVAIELTPATTGDIAFSCGMNMLKGVIVAR